MKDFEKWYSELISDERWMENASLNHKPETFRQVANKVYVNGLADSKAFEIVPMREHRQHVYNKVSKLPHDKVKKKWFEQVLDERKPEPEWQPLTGEQRQQRLKEWRSAIESTPKVHAPPKLTSEQIKEEGDWIAKKVPAHPSTSADEVAKRILHHEYLKANYNILTGDPLDSWEPEDRWIELQNL